MFLFLKRIFNKKSFYYHSEKNRFHRLHEKGFSCEDIETEIKKSCHKNRLLCIQSKKAFFTLFKDIYKEQSIRYGEEIIKIDTSDISFIQVLAVRQKRQGNKQRYNELIQKFHLILKESKLKQVFSLEIFRSKLEIYLEENDENIFLYIDKMLKKYPKDKVKIIKTSFVLLKDIYPEKSIGYGEEIIKIDTSDISFIQVLAVRHRRQGNIKRYNELIDTFHLLLKKSKLKQVFSLEIFRSKLEIYLEENDENIFFYIDKMLKKYPKDKVKIIKTSFNLLKDLFPRQALYYLDKIIDEKVDKKILSIALTRAKRIYDTKRLCIYGKLLKNDLAEYYCILDENNGLFKLIEGHLESNNDEEAQKILTKLLDKYIDFQDIIYFIFAKMYFSHDVNKFLKLLDKATQINKNFFSQQLLFELYLEKGYYSLALESIKVPIDNKMLLRKEKMVKENISLLNDGMKSPSKNIFYEDFKNNKILYFVYNSLPYHNSGYAIRTHQCITAINKDESTNISVEVVSRLGYPVDSIKNLSADYISSKEFHDGATYHRLLSDIKKGSIGYEEYILEYTKSIIDLANIEKPFLLHSASNFLNGIATIHAAKILGIKSIYEIRGLWEVTAISNKRIAVNSEEYELHKYLETYAAKEADRVITITEALKEEMVNRGVDKSKIIVVPNGVDSNKFIPLNADILLKKKLSINNEVVIGYVGSFVDYEGLDILIEAIGILVKRDIKNIKVLLVGDGKIYAMLLSKVKSLNLEEYCIFTGRVLYEEVSRYYSVIDIAPFPRKGVPICEMVSPLKPFEAMSMQIASIASDVGALSEIINHKVNGLLFKKDNASDLADKLELLIEDKNLRQLLGRNARKWIIDNRDWKTLSKKFVTIYNDMKE